jgi:hypothetical protein
MRTGRPSKLTTAVCERILTNMRAGVSGEIAAQAEGVSRTTFYAWKAKGERQAQGIYRDFLDGVKRAEAEVELSCATIVCQAMPTTWQAAAWMLERRWPQRWGRNDRLELELHQDARAIARPLGLDAAELIEIAEEIVRAQDEPEP